MDKPVTIALAAGAVLLTFKILGGNAAAAQSGGDTFGDSSPVSLSGISSDIATWPTGDRIWDVCRAIANQEGASIAGTVPDRLNNPGDISDGSLTFGAEFHSGSSVTHFPNKDTGWQWLYDKIKNAASGSSIVYRPSMDFYDIGAIWAPPNANSWAEGVAYFLGVDPSTTLGQYIGG